jgi:hypothetical protein
MLCPRWRCPVSKFTAQQIVQTISDGIGTSHLVTDEVVINERLKIADKYRELKYTERFFSKEELQEHFPHMLSNHPKGGMMLPGFEECSIEARAWWLTENVL